MHGLVPSHDDWSRPFWTPSPICTGPETSPKLVRPEGVG